MRTDCVQRWTLLPQEGLHGVLPRPCESIGLPHRDKGTGATVPSSVSQGTAAGTTFLPVSQSKPHCSLRAQTHALFSTDNCCLLRCSRRRAGTSDTIREKNGALETLSTLISILARSFLPSQNPSPARGKSLSINDQCRVFGGESHQQGRPAVFYAGFHKLHFSSTRFLPPLS